MIYSSPTREHPVIVSQLYKSLSACICPVSQQGVMTKAESFSKGVGKGWWEDRHILLLLHSENSQQIELRIQGTWGLSDSCLEKGPFEYECLDSRRQMKKEIPGSCHDYCHRWAIMRLHVFRGKSYVIWPQGECSETQTNQGNAQRKSQSWSLEVALFREAKSNSALESCPEVWTLRPVYHPTL